MKTSRSGMKTEGLLARGTPCQWCDRGRRHRRKVPPDEPADVVRQCGEAFATIVEDPVHPLEAEEQHDVDEFEQGDVVWG